jgi:hypothetical protein
MKQFFGWKPNSNTPAIYISLSSEDMKAAVLSDRYGIVERKQISKDLEVWKCPKCWKTVSTTATFCYNCGAPLTKDAQQNNDTVAQELMKLITSDPDLVAKLAAAIQKQ